MAEPKARPKRRASSATVHHEPYPDRLHRHLSGAADAAAALVSPEADGGQAPSTAGLVEAYAASESVNTSQSEGGSGGTD